MTVLTLAVAPRAEAYVYWANTNWMNPGSGTIGRANLDGSGVDERFITGVGVPAGVAVNSTHIYWIRNETGTIGRARLDGTGATPYRRRAGPGATRWARGLTRSTSIG